jgi:hypothetical protein
MPLFKDFGKAAKDLLSKNYDSDKHKIEVSSKTKDVSFDGEWSSKGNSKLESEYKLPNNVAFNLELLSDGQVTGTFKLKDFARPGLTLKSKTSTANKAFIGVEYVQDFGTITADVDHDIVKQSTVLNVSSLFSRRNFLAGGSVQVTPKDGLTKYEIGAGFIEPSTFEVTAVVSEDLVKASAPQVLVRYIHFVDKTWTYGAKFNTSLESPAKSSVELGGAYNLNSDTKLGLKIDSASQLGFHHVSKLNPNVTLTQSLQLDLNDRSAPHKFGLGVKFSQ